LLSLAKARAFSTCIASEENDRRPLILAVKGKEEHCKFLSRRRTSSLGNGKRGCAWFGAGDRRCLASSSGMLLGDSDQCMALDEELND
jgi:hypothetical protein